MLIVEIYKGTAVELLFYIKIYIIFRVIYNIKAMRLLKFLLQNVVLYAV